jgi:hypothetical protein
MFFNVDAISWFLIANSPQELSQSIGVLRGSGRGLTRRRGLVRTVDRRRRRAADDFTSASTGDNAHSRLSGHVTIHYSGIEAPERISSARRKAKSINGSHGKELCHRMWR